MFFFDTETTGLPLKDKTARDKYFPYENLEAYDSSRIVSISWLVYDFLGKLKAQKYFIIKPDGFVSHPKALEVHKITHEEAMEKGVPITEVFKQLKEDLKDETTLLAYNAKFDYNILLSEGFRYNDRELVNMVKTRHLNCIQKIAINKIDNLVCRYRYFPKMEEVIRHLFPSQETVFNTSHNALDDTYQCAKIFFYLNSGVYLKPIIC